MDASNLFKTRETIPVVIIEQRQLARKSRLLQKSMRKRVFVGKLSVLSIMMTGLRTYLNYFGSTKGSIVETELMQIFSRAKIDANSYRVVDFFQRQGRLEIYVMNNVSG